MTIAQRDIAALIGSRICHDLISPIGAIGNGVELLGMAGSVDGPEMALISESVMNANARIRYFRIAFGAAKSEQLMGRSEIMSVLKDVGAGSRVQVAWQSDDKVPRDQVKLAFLLIQCFESSLPYGGTITIVQEQDSWVLECNAERMKIDTTIWEFLISANADKNISPAEVHFALVPDAAKNANRNLRTDLRENAITLTF
ncbi:histidine phosphotransferase [Marinosulfonomonas sp. PRT-SC04]|nr:histidine phosphotransferase [Marinosulfonomonas sp. PRT-SC04]